MISGVALPSPGKASIHPMRGNAPPELIEVDERRDNESAGNRPQKNRHTQRCAGCVDQFAGKYTRPSPTRRR